MHEAPCNDLFSVRRSGKSVCKWPTPARLISIIALVLFTFFFGANTVRKRHTGKAHIYRQGFSEKVEHPDSVHWQIGCCATKWPWWELETWPEEVSFCIFR